MQARDPEYRGGANRVSLREARANFTEFGASERSLIQHSRSPGPQEASSTLHTVYVALLGEGTSVWRPVQAVSISGERWRSVSSVVEGDRWEFPPGSVVRCAERVFADGQRGLVAVEAVDA